ncbi:MAG: tetratricopeptide repeat protein [Burkholderiales bacterium]
MHDVQRLLRLPRSTIRSLVHAGFVTPSRGARGAWRFSFQDLIVLRTAQALVEANVPARRITRSMRELKRRLPEAMPLSGLAIGAVADRVVVREGAARWQADSGQYVLEFEADPASGAPRVIERAPARSAQSWFEEAAALESSDAAAAERAYEQAIAADPAYVDAPVNLGRLLHDRGELARAERVYREAMTRCGSDPLLLFNLGVLLEDQGKRDAAVEAYRAAVAADPGLADAHYNLALLYEALARPKDAIRHMARYRVLRGSG